MDSARLSALRSRREEQESSSSDSEDESSSSGSSSSSSSSSELSSSASSGTSSEDETEDPKPSAAQQPNAQSSVKIQSSVSSSDRKSNDVEVKSIASKSSPEPTAGKTSRSSTEEANIKTVVKEDEKNAKKTSKFTENESDGPGARKSKIPFLETSSKKIASTVAEVKNEELPNLSARKSITTKRASESEETSGKVEIKSKELPNLSAKTSTTKKSSEVEEAESEKTTSKISGIRERMGKVSTLDDTIKDDSKVKAVKEKADTTSSENSEHSKEVSGKVSKLSGSVKKFENFTEEKDNSDDLVKKPLEKLLGGKVKKSASANDHNEDAKREKIAPDAVMSVPKKNPASDRTVDEPLADSDKVSKIPKFKKSTEKLNSAEDKATVIVKPAKLSGSEKQKSKENAEDEKIEKPVEKVGKKSKISSTETSTVENDKVEKPVDKVDKKSKISSAETSTVEDDKVEKPVEKVSKKSKISSSENHAAEDDKVEKPVEKIGKKSKLSSTENITVEDDKEEKPVDKVGKKSKISSVENDTVEDEKVEKPAEKVGKKSKISSAENDTVEDDKMEKNSEKVNKKSKISSAENHAPEDDKVEKPVEKVGKKSSISSAENITVEDDAVEKTAEKVSKKSKIISPTENNTAEDGGDKKSEALDIEGSSGLTLEVGSNKETVKKRKKSPIKDTAEGEDERKPSEALIDDLKKPSAEIKTDEDQASDSNKLSLDIADSETPTKTKRGSKRSSKSPTPVNEATVDENPTREAVENVEKTTNNEPAPCSNKLSTENSETETPAKTKKGSKKSSKSPTPVNEAIADEKLSLQAGGEDAIKSSLGVSSHGVDLAAASVPEIAVVEKIDPTKLEITCTKPSDENTTVTVVIADNLSVTGESVAKEIEKMSGGDFKTDALKKNDDNDVAIITVQQSPDTGAKFETLEKPTEGGKPADETLIAAAQIDGKSKGAEEPNSVPVKTAAVEDASAGPAAAAPGPTGDEEGIKFDVRKETVDDFIQRILSEVRSSDQHLKELAKERTEFVESEAAPVEKRSEEQTNEETETIVQVVAKKETLDNDDHVTAKPPAAANKPTAVDQTPKEDNFQIKQRSRYPADEDEELAILAKYFGRKGGGRPLGGGGGGGGGTDPLLQDIDASDELDIRSPGAAETVRHRRQDVLDQDHEDYDFDRGSDYGPPFARTMAGPKVSSSRRNFQRYNFGESDLNGRDDGGFVSRFRRDRHGGGGGGVLSDEAFLPRRSEETPEVVRQRSRGARTLVEKQTEVVDAVKRAAKGLEDLEREILGVKQASLGYRTHVEALETAFDAEARTYETEYQAALESTRQQQRRQPPQGGQRKREDFVGLMFGSKPTSFADPTGVEAFSTPAVASFMNIYGSGGGGQRGGVEVNGVAEGQQQRPPAHEFGYEAANSVRVGPAKVDDYLSALERRYESTGRKDREPDAAAGVSGWSPTVSGIDVGTSASDELLNRIRAKYPISSSLSSPPSSLADSTGSSSRFTDLTSGYAGPSSNGQWSSRGQTRGSSGGYYGGGGYSAPSSSFSDGYSSWRDRGAGGGRRSNQYGGDVGGFGSGSDSSWRRSGGGASDSYLDRPFSTGSRTRRS